MKTNSQDITSNTYRVENRVAYIIALQRMLGITESGRLDSVTRAKIATFKNEHGIASDKMVDFETFVAIKVAYLKRLVACEDASYAPYDYGQELRGICEMLRLVISYYSLPIRLPHGAVYGYDAIRAVRCLRAMYCLRDGEWIDGELIYYMERDIRSINAMKKHWDAR